MSIIIKSLNWRYAVKKMNGNKISDNKLNIILESIRLCPTSLGMQPFEVIVIKNEEIKKKIFPFAFNQTQIINCSHLIIFAFWYDYYEKKVDEYIDNIQKVRQVKISSLIEFKNLILDFLSSKTIEQKRIWAKNQTYIALGMSLMVCALEKIDSTPMEGFQNDKIDNILNLKNKNLCSSVILALGYRDEKKDNTIHAKKVRQPFNKFFHFMK